MSGKPDWLATTTSDDWLLDGATIKSSGFTHDAWNGLDWSRAYVDPGPSPAGNPGPYWHVPYPAGEADETWHRLYPKVLRGKWAPVIRQAIAETQAAQQVRE